MAVVTTRIRGHRAQSLHLIVVSDVIDQRPGTIQCRGSQITRMPLDYIASGVANRTIDALYTGISLHSMHRGWKNGLHVVVAGFTWMETTLCAIPLVEELRHIASQVFDYGQVAQGFDGQGVFVQHLLHVGTACPPRFAVDHHSAGTTHTHTACETIAQFWIEVALNPSNHIEDSLAFE